MPSSSQGLDDGRVDSVGRGGAGRADLDAVASEVGEVGGGHLGPAGVVDADEQDRGLVGHQQHAGVCASAVAAAGVQQAPSDDSVEHAQEFWRPGRRRRSRGVVVLDRVDLPRRASGVVTQTLSCRA